MHALRGGEAQVQRLTMGMVYSTAMKSRRPHAKSAGSGCRRRTPAALANEHHSGSLHVTSPLPSAAPITFFPAAPFAGAGWTLAAASSALLQRRAVVVVDTAVRSHFVVRLGGSV